MASKKDKISKLLEEAITNVHSDRKLTSSLLRDVMTYIGEKADRHGEVGLTTAKYLEVLQKSNEQLVKIASLITDIKDDEFGDLDQSEKEDIYKEFEELPEQIEIMGSTKEEKEDVE